jgi:hypothetical protein
MKRKIETWLMVVLCLAYLVAYFAVRSKFGSEGVEFKPDSSGHGYLPPVDYTATQFYAPSRGMQRVWEYSLYYAFYPLGKMDSCLTKRKYEIMDGRRTIY